MRSVFMRFSLILILVFSACTPNLYSYRRTAAEQANPSPIRENDPNVGTWETLDVTVTYSYTKMEGAIELSGSIDLNERFRYGLTDIEYFHLWISFVDAELRIIENRRIFSVGYQGFTDRLHFGDTIELPENTEAISFAYSGQIRGSAAEVGFLNTRDSPLNYDPLGIPSMRGAETGIHPAGP